MCLSNTVCAHCSIKLTWFGAEGFPRRPSQGLLWYCCYGSPCKYKNILLVRQFINMFLILCVWVWVCVFGGARVKSYVLMLHLPLHSWKTFLDKWDVNTHTYAVSVSHMRAAEHLLKPRENMVCLCVRACASVCTCRRAGAWVWSQHLLRAREIVSECHIKIT